MPLPAIRFIARTGGAQQGMNRLGNATIRFSQAATSNIARVGAALSAVGALSIRMSSDLDEQLRKVQNLTGFSAQARLQLSQDIDRLSRTHGLDARSLAEGAEAVHTQGVAVSNLAKELDLASKVANAFGGSFEDIARNLTKMANVWDINTDRIVAFGQAGARIGDTNLTKLLEGATVVSPAAKQAGVAYDEMAIFLGFATRELKNTRISATALRQVFDELSRSESRIATTIQNRYGQTFKELVEQAGSAYDVFERIEKDFGSGRFIQLLSSVDAKSGLTTILEQLDEIRSEALIPVEVHAEGLEEAFQNIAESFDEKLRIFAQSWRSFLRNLTDVQPGDAIYETLESLTDVLNSESFRKAFSDLAESLTTFAPIIGQAAKTLSGVLTTELPGTGTSAVDLLVYSTLLQGSFNARNRALAFTGDAKFQTKNTGSILQGRVGQDMTDLRSQVKTAEMYDRAFTKSVSSNTLLASQAAFLYGDKVRGRQFAPISDKARDISSVAAMDSHIAKGVAKQQAIAYEKLVAENQDFINRPTTYKGVTGPPSERTVRARKQLLREQGAPTTDSRLKANQARTGRASAMWLALGLGSPRRFGKETSKKVTSAIGKGLKGTTALVGKFVKPLGSAVARSIPGIATGLLANEVIKGATGVNVLAGLGTGIGKAISFINPFGGGKADPAKQREDLINKIRNFGETARTDKDIQNELDKVTDGQDSLDTLLDNLTSTIEDSSDKEIRKSERDKSEYLSALDTLTTQVRDSGLSEDVQQALLNNIADNRATAQGDLEDDAADRARKDAVYNILRGTTSPGSEPFWTQIMSEEAYAGLEQAGFQGMIRILNQTLSPQAQRQLVSRLGGTLSSQEQYESYLMDELQGNRAGRYPELQIAYNAIGSTLPVDKKKVDAFDDLFEATVANFGRSYYHSDDPAFSQSTGRILEETFFPPYTPTPAPYVPLIKSSQTSFIEDKLAAYKTLNTELAFYQNEHDWLQQYGPGADLGQLGRGRLAAGQWTLPSRLEHVSPGALATGQANAEVDRRLEQGTLTNTYLDELIAVAEADLSFTKSLLGIAEETSERAQDRNLYYAGVLYSEYDARAGV